MSQSEPTPPQPPLDPSAPSDRRATHVCAFCGGAFKPRHGRQRYCVAAHRKAAWSARHPRLTVTRVEFAQLAGELFDDIISRQARRG